VLDPARHHVDDDGTIREGEHVRGFVHPADVPHVLRLLPPFPFADGDIINVPPEP
jgi:hypothetical protein